MKKILLLFIVLQTIGACTKDETEQLRNEIPTISTVVVSTITSNSASGGGCITDNGNSPITESGICYNTIQKPTTENNATKDGETTGCFTSKLTHLTANTTYYLRAYAINKIGTAYGSEVEFTTLNNLPTLTTIDISNITSNSASSGGNILNDGGSPISKSGVCYSTSQNPTIADNATKDGGSIGSYTSNLTKLIANTTYYLRSYATNSNGTAYGDKVQFTTNAATFTGQTIMVDGGTFQMGSPDKIGSSDEHPQHTVTLNSFNMSKYEITNQQYIEFMNSIGAKSNGSFNGIEYLDMDDADIEVYFSNDKFIVTNGKENYPIMEITWAGAKAYSEYYGGRLPTEAEWEFASRGGNNSKDYTYSGSDNIDDVAWHNDNSDKSTHEVGTKNANELGIYDMTGNVWEWCNDKYSKTYYSNSPSDNPQGASAGKYNVFRGGSWDTYDISNCRTAYRNAYYPKESFNKIGFRPVFTP